jgi:hypothetical protein
MAILIGIILSLIFTTSMANNRGRSAFGYFILSLFISPVLCWILLGILGKTDKAKKIYEQELAEKEIRRIKNAELEIAYKSSLESKTINTQRDYVGEFNSFIKKIALIVKEKYLSISEKESKVQIVLIIWSFIHLFFFLLGLVTIPKNSEIKLKNEFWFFERNVGLTYDVSELFIFVGTPWLIYYLYSKYFKNEN